MASQNRGRDRSTRSAAGCTRQLGEFAVTSTVFNGRFVLRRRKPAHASRGHARSPAPRWRAAAESLHRSGESAGLAPALLVVGRHARRRPTSDPGPLFYDYSGMGLCQISLRRETREAPARPRVNHLRGCSSSGGVGAPSAGKEPREPPTAEPQNDQTDGDAQTGWCCIHSIGTSATSHALSLQASPTVAHRTPAH